MRKILIAVFGLLMVASILLCVLGFVGFAVTSWLSPDEAELIGVILFTVAGMGELGVYCFGWALHRSGS